MPARLIFTRSHPVTSPTHPSPPAAPPSLERIRKERLDSGLRLSVTNLRSHDSGNFSCETLLPDETIVLKSFILYVRPREWTPAGRSGTRVGSRLGRLLW